MKRWLIRVTLNYCKDAARAAKRRVPTPPEELARGIPFEVEEQIALFTAVISMQGYRDSAEFKAPRDYYYGGLTLEQAAGKYGLTVPERCEVFQYDEMAELLGGELTDERRTRWAFIVYEDGTFSGDQAYTDSEGNLVMSYQMLSSVKCPRFHRGHTPISS